MMYIFFFFYWKTRIVSINTTM